MDYNSLEYLKRKIKRTYKRYTGERTDEAATIEDVARFFNIPVCVVNRDDFKILNIDFKTPAIEMINTQTNTTYKAAYTSEARLFNCGGGPIRFNSVIMTSPQCEQESLYYIGSETPIISRMIFKNNDKKLAFVREYPNYISLFSLSDGTGFEIKYTQDIVVGDQMQEQILLTKRYIVNEKSPDRYDTFEHLYTYSSNLWIPRNGHQDKYNYETSNGAVYGIREYEQEGLCGYLNGVCFENANRSDVKQLFPSSMSDEQYLVLKSGKFVSFAVFECNVDGIRHTIIITKDENNIKIKHKSVKYHYDDGLNIENLDDEEFTLPLFSKGNISLEEIENIMVAIEFKFENKKLARIIANELSIFGKKIAIRKCKMEEEQDLLAPKEFIYEPFEAIETLIGENKEEYFRLAEEQFRMATDLKSSLEQGKTRVLDRK